MSNHTSLCPSLPRVMKPPPASSALSLLAAPSSPRKGSCRLGFRSSRSTRRRTHWARSMAMPCLPESPTSSCPCRRSIRAQVAVDSSWLLSTFTNRHYQEQLWSVGSRFGLNFGLSLGRLQLKVFVKLFPSQPFPFYTYASVSCTYPCQSVCNSSLSFHAMSTSWGCLMYWSVSMAGNYGSLPVFLWLSVTPTLALSGSHCHSLAYSGPLWHTIAL